jgi:hypothetical protein
MIAAFPPCERDCIRNLLADAISTMRLLLHVSRFRGGRSTAELAFRAQVLVNVGPVNAKSGSTNFPVRPLFDASVQKPGIPRERNDDRAAVCEVYG